MWVSNKEQKKFEGQERNDSLSQCQIRNFLFSICGAHEKIRLLWHNMKVIFISTSKLRLPAIQAYNIQSGQYKSFAAVLLSCHMVRQPKLASSPYSIESPLRYCSTAESSSVPALNPHP